MPAPLQPYLSEAELKTCPNAKCKLMNDDAVGQCPGCGAPMSRAADAAPQMTPNSHLYQMRADAGMAAPVGQTGGLRPGSEPMYKDTAAVKAVALEVIGGFGV